MCEQMALAKPGHRSGDGGPALRRRGAWREAVAADASPQTQRSLRRAWERGRDDALAVLAELDVPVEDDSSS